MVTGILSVQGAIFGCTAMRASPPTWLRGIAAAKRNVAGGVRHTRQS
jgi:hypothetical protein